MATQEKNRLVASPLVESQARSAKRRSCGTRMPVNAIVDNFDYGVSVPEIAEQ
jgi:hypothetical protein